MVFRQTLDMTTEHALFTNLAGVFLPHYLFMKRNGR